MVDDIIFTFNLKFNKLRLMGIFTLLFFDPPDEKIAEKYHQK